MAKLRNYQEQHDLRVAGAWLIDQLRGYPIPDEPIIQAMAAWMVWDGKDLTMVDAVWELDAAIFNIDDHDDYWEAYALIADFCGVREGMHHNAQEAH